MLYWIPAYAGMGANALQCGDRFNGVRLPARSLNLKPKPKTKNLKLINLNTKTMPTKNNTTNIDQADQSSFISTEVDTTIYEKILKQNDFDGRTIGQVLNAIAAISDDKNVEKGAQFEKLTQWALPLIKATEIKKVSKPRGKDIGADLIATSESGHDIAIQCKFYTTRNIRRNDFVTFLAAANRKKITTKWLVCGGMGISKDAEDFIHDEGIQIIDMRTYRDTVLTIKKPEPRQPHPLQQTAIDAVLQGFANAERGKLIMACGSGKTFTALRIAEALIRKNANLLFIAPSIALVAQARNEWLEHSTRKLRTLVICSDAGAGRDDDIRPNEIAGHVTTDPSEIAAMLTEDSRTPISESAARATFCTYQSLEKLQQAQAEHGAPKFDLVIIDEAHRTTGLLDEKQPGFLLIHDKEKIQADKRLYMTATPRIYKESKSKRNSDAVVVDMNDVTRYGAQFHHLTFKDAVEDGMLCDYRVIAMGVSEGMVGAQLQDTLLALNDELALSEKSSKGKAADDQTVLALFSVALAINGFMKGDNFPGVIERTIAYTNNIRRSKWTVKAINQPKMKEWITKNRYAQNSADNKALSIVAAHLDGTDNVVQRNHALQKLSEESNDQFPHLISNVKLFTEGVDVPALNAIAFLDPRDSKIDTVQAVGRVMRRDPKNPKKIFGYIIVPVILPDGADLLETLEKDKSRFKSLGNVLRALQSHDERLYTDLPNRLSVVAIKRDGPPPIDGESPNIQADFLDENALQAIHTKIAAHSGLARPGKQIADAITQAIETAARIFEEERVTKIIADTIGTPTDNEKESCKTAALLIANACIMHKRLEETGNLAGLTRIESANNQASPASALSAAWETILQKDYAPIFMDANALLRQLPDNPKIRVAIKVLAECAINQATVLNDLGFDHAGPLYHRVLGTATSDGAFFTKNLSAYLLAGLAFDDDFTNWKDMNAVKKLRIADPACGTGTLLMAALKAIKDKASNAQNLNAEQIEKLHKHLVENALYGFDINKYSIQLAACNLTIGAPNTDYSGMNLYTLQHGPLPNTDGDKPHEVRHGALEILLGKMDASLLQQQIAEVDGMYGTNAERIKKEFHAPENLDAVIYNPPFTETLNQSERYGPAIKQAMADRLGLIRDDLAVKDPSAVKAIGKRSIGPYFTPMTNRLLSPQKGTMAKIIPTTACTSENGRAERQYIAANFQIDMVVTSHDPKHINFSENTSIHECLIIARRSLGQRKPTRFIQLAKYPQNVAETQALVAAIQTATLSDLFSETLWSADKVKAGDWSPVQWMNPKLADAALKLNTLSNCISGDAYRWRPDGQPIRVTFTYERSDSGDVFCTINEDVMQTISATPESKATTRPKKEREAEKLWQQTDHVLVACRFRTTNTRLTAVYSEKPAIGSAFRPIGVNNKETAKAYAAFFNSSFGVIQMLNRRTRMLTYPAFEASHMKTLMLPDPNKADLTPLLKAFEKVKDIPLKRLSECATDPSRKILDHAAAQALGIDPAITDQWRKWLSHEPTITNKPWTPNEDTTN